MHMFKLMTFSSKLVLLYLTIVRGKGTHSLVGTLSLVLIEAVVEIRRRGIFSRYEEIYRHAAAH